MHFIDDDGDQVEISSNEDLEDCYESRKGTSGKIYIKKMKSSKPTSNNVPSSSTPSTHQPSYSTPHSPSPSTPHQPSLKKREKEDNDQGCLSEQLVESLSLILFFFLK